MSWVSTSEAARVVGANKSVFVHWAQANGLSRKVVRKGHMWKADEVRALKIHQKSINAEVGRASEVGTVVALVAWADSLTEWPSDAEIHRRTTKAYRFKDVVSVIESRIFRGVEPLDRPAVLCYDDDNTTQNTQHEGVIA